MLIRLIHGYNGYSGTPEVLRPRERNIQRKPSDSGVPRERETQAVTSRLPQNPISSH
jgi:hypothetical protein